MKDKNGRNIVAGDRVLYVDRVWGVAKKGVELFLFHRPTLTAFVPGPTFDSRKLEVLQPSVSIAELMKAGDVVRQSIAKCDRQLRFDRIWERCVFLFIRACTIVGIGFLLAMAWKLFHLVFLKG